MATATSSSASEYPGAAPADCRQVLRRERAVRKGCAAMATSRCRREGRRHGQR